ncbi:MAG: ABC transporter substrate-binding protein [Flavobacteriaceae bacterium]|nr:ABC transporter substrate-binding protein [Bacteroidia bacterium]MBT8288127.1 ABC transporter substrate-binding protein [Bacteroidia bacterium]NNF74063.1 ABC transporter substrate-binding protein [Flavobacteriaceae bacterium]NNK73579.1 ABC transporter substrate-binding protein [Flavobacteriaceae bacterium]
MLVKKIFIYITILFTTWIYSQDFTAEWQGHFSYFKINDVVKGNNKVYAAADNAVFTYDLITSEIGTITTVNGLSGDQISTIYYSESFDKLVIGYQNGLIEIYSESDGSIFSIVDIIEKPTISPEDKQINHFNEHDDLVYISTDYGISIYDLDALEFGDTYFIGPDGVQAPVRQTAIYDEYIFAAHKSNFGLRKAPIASTNLIDFNEWTQLTGGTFVGVESIGESVYALRAVGRLLNVTGPGIFEVANFGFGVKEMGSSEDKLIIVKNNEVLVLDPEINPISNHTVTADFDTTFNTATIALDEIFIGTDNFGLLNAPLNDPISYVAIYPDGPLRNDAFNIQAGFGDLWVAYGDYTLTYNPSPIRRYGLSQLQNGEWNNIANDSLFNARNLNAISINPSLPTQVFVSSFNDGIVELNNGQPTVLYDQTNSGLESLILPNNPSFVSIRVSGSTFDSEGILWSMTSRVDRPLKSYNPETGQWQGFDFTEIIPEGLFDELGFSDIVVDNRGIKWIGGLKSGVIGFNNETGEIKNIFDIEIANLPNQAVKALAVDKRNQLWIGTIEGLRVLYNTSNFFDDDAVRTQEIIILEDGIPKELLQFQYISDIKVDGGNNKWISTIGSGIFYFSADGQETIYHFTKDNSPLPSNNVIDSSIDTNSGVVYMATDRGLVSFRSGSSKPQDDLADAFIFPNPVRPGFSMIDKKIKIKDVSENVNIKITDIEGNLVAEAESNRNLRFKGYNLEIDGGTAYWNGKNLANNEVSSGVYLVMLSDLDTLETRVLKLMVIR